MPQVFLNNQFIDQKDAKISVLDRGFLFGDGVYEVIPVYGRYPLMLDGHLNRLQNSLKGLFINCPFNNDKNKWREIILELINKNDESQPIFIEVTRGVQESRQHLFDDSMTPTVLIMSQEKIKLGSCLDSKGITTITQDDIRWKRCNVKSISLVANILMRHEAVLKNASESFLIKDKIVNECASANFFIVKDGVFKTPCLQHNILPGLTRHLIIKILKDNNLKIIEDKITEDELKSADEVMISSSTREVVPVVKIDDVKIGDGKPGEYWSKLANLYVETVQCMIKEK